MMRSMHTGEDSVRVSRKIVIFTVTRNRLAYWKRQNIRAYCKRCRTPLKVGDRIFSRGASSHIRHRIYHLSCWEKGLL